MSQRNLIALALKAVTANLLQDQEVYFVTDPEEEADNISAFHSFFIGTSQKIPFILDCPSNVNKPPSFELLFEFAEKCEPRLAFRLTYAPEEDRKLFSILSALTERVRTPAFPIRETARFFQDLVSVEDGKRRDMLLQLAKLGALTDGGKGLSIPRIMGGLKPRIFVLDDYNNFIIRKEDGSFVAVELAGHVKTLYQSDNIEESISGYANNLNHLEIAATIHAPSLLIPESDAGSPTYNTIHTLLPVEEMDTYRSEIAAIIVDLEWLPSKKPVTPQPGDHSSDGTAWKGIWKEAGLMAIQLLRRRYPEIPCFVYTGEWNLEKLQKALASGAEWCFRKAQSHHGFHSPRNEREEDNWRYDLTLYSLTMQLEEAAISRYGALPQGIGITDDASSSLAEDWDIPLPNQLQLTGDTDGQRRLIKALGLEQPLGRCVRGRNLQQLVNRLFPDAIQVTPVETLKGKSKAQAVFFAVPANSTGTLATRLVKVASWPVLYKEFLAYSRIIRPRLNSHTANILTEPATTGVSTGWDMPFGALQYTLAGFPEGYRNLSSLNQRLGAQLANKGAGAQLAGMVQKTLNTVLAPLYGIQEEATSAHRQKRPLWDWLGWSLPPLVTGILVPLEVQFSRRDKDCLTIQGRAAGYPLSTAWVRAQRDLQKLSTHSTSEEALPSLWERADHQAWRNACFTYLQGFSLEEVEWGKEEIGEVMLRHPDLGYRVRLRGRADDIRRRFSATWLRSGMPVDVFVVTDEKNRDGKKLKEDILGPSLRQMPIFGADSQDTDQALAKLFECFGSLPELEQPQFDDPITMFVAGPPVGAGLQPHYTIRACRGAIHGDLNLDNILFPDDANVGWLIDFECAHSDGMVAYDIAKFEGEIWSHHLIPALLDIAGQWPEDGELPIKLLAWALLAADTNSMHIEPMEARFYALPHVGADCEAIWQSVRNAFHVLRTIRGFAFSKLSLEKEELWWALSAYLLVAIKFQPREQPWRAILIYLISAWYLGKVAPRMRGNIDEKLLTQLGEIPSALTQMHKREVDGLLMDARRRRIQADELASSMDKTALDWTAPEGKPSTVERWDLASTGGVANITPLFGYLLLMARQKSGENIAVPKISSRGSSCGTVDILESGGFHFISDPKQILHRCHRDGGVLCRQDKTLTPIDQALMARRKEVNAMKDPTLTYASIISKKRVMGCTHVIVDVKAGHDTKFVSPWFEKDSLDKWMGPGSDESLLRTDVLEDLELLLKSISSPASTSSTSQGWLGYKPSESLNPLKEIRWFVTDGDQPLCRAIGRQLILLHLDDLVTGCYGEKLLEKENRYREFYLRFLPEICELQITEADGKPDDGVFIGKVREQWKLLKNKLPEMGKFPAIKFFQRLKENRAEEKLTESFSKDILHRSWRLEPEMDVLVMTVSLGPYQPQWKTGTPLTVKRIHVWKLDALFSYLCGEDEFDPEVGIYLHCLPGEELGDVDTTPFLSVFFRPSRTREQDVFYMVSEFLTKHVVVAKRPGS
uniref:Phosphotransferase enzyme family protein n=1 Tax=Candidatus Kentrum sp. DK TaxID=2126562 RepID=A0A450SR85_9GAMM|nr:MAG: Phosphotransferase enzyme family protein [Candidatus Kentron sp. DK]